MEKHEKIARGKRVYTWLKIIFTVAFLGGVGVAWLPSAHQPVVHHESEEVLVARMQELDTRVREIKATNVLMEVDPQGVEATKALQEATRQLLARRFGSKEPYRVRVDLRFQESNPTYHTTGDTASFLIELAPSSLQPHSVFTFLQIARFWSHAKEGGGAFHRRAPHVLQVLVNGGFTKHLAFQEYSPEYPHTKGTVGYAGRPSGPGWYVSTMDNTKTHGPGSQQKANPYEADSCFGKVIEGFDDVVVDRVGVMPGDGFLTNPKDHVLIEKMTILVPILVPGEEQGGEYVEWWEPTQQGV